MTTKKPKPLTILGAPLRKTKYGWTAKTKLGRVRLYKQLALVDACIELADGTWLELVEWFGLERVVLDCERMLRSIHRACQVKL